MRRARALEILCLLAAVAYPAMAFQEPQPVSATTSSTTATQSVSSGSMTTPQFSQRYPRYQINPGDTVELVFEFTPEFNQTVTVQPDGFITLKNIGDVHVSQETVAQLTATVTQEYSKILNNPSISVVLKDFERPYFIAQGQVGHPGKYVLRSDTTVSEAIAMAGGFTDKSKHSHVVLFRRVNDQWTEAKLLDMKKMLNKADLTEDVMMKPGDMLFVPQNNISKIERFLPNTGISAYMGPATF